MNIVATRSELRTALDAARRTAAPIALVPTMGYLHEGHLQLFDRAAATGATVVASSFVNPLQFGPGEDFARYPRDPERDTQLARKRGVAIYFAPELETMYPDGPSRVRLAAPGLADRLCGRYRPGHFEGVLTVVAKLFHLVAPDRAVFGQKDLQQAALIRRMVRDLDFPVAIDIAPIVREPDGLAMSSRNAYLTPEQRAAAAAIPVSLQAAQAAFAAGARAAEDLLEAVRRMLAAGTAVRLQYAELVDPDTLEPGITAEVGMALAIAAFVGETRLIDNHILTG